MSDQPTQVFAYFADGSLRSKTGVGTGDYEYLEQGANAVRPHAVKSIAGGMSFSYDNNGNVKTAGNLSVSWTSFDMPKLISRNGYSSGFIYGSEHQRVRQDRGDGSTIVYAGAQEVETKGTVVTVRTYWPMGIGLEIDSTGKPQQMNWIQKDRLGSPVALTGPDGAIVEKLAYDAWGKRRTPDGSSTADSIDGVTDHRGYTGHEMLDQLDLVHMNGRVYDPLTAKFLSGDPLIQDPMNGQNYNRYSYVLNNPTNVTDPTGFTSVTVTGDRINVMMEEFKLQDVLRALQQQQQAGRKTVTVALSWPAAFGSRIAKRGGYTVTVRLNPDDSEDNEAAVTNLTAGDVIQSEFAGAGNRIANMAVGAANLLIAMSPGDAELIDPVRPFTPKSNYFGQRGEATADGLLAVSGATALGKGVAGAVDSAANTVRVGRWMSQAEYQAMRESGRVQEGAGGATFVANSGPSEVYCQ